MLRRTVLWTPEMTDVDRPETPDAVDITTRTQRTAILFGGLAHHRKAGGRMLDTLLVAGAETARSFTMGVVLDLEHPFHAAQDLVTPAAVVPIDHGPPAVGLTGWLVRLDRQNVAITRVEFTENAGERGWGLVFHLVETSGQSVVMPAPSVPQPELGPAGRLPGGDDRRSLRRGGWRPVGPDAARDRAGGGGAGVEPPRRSPPHPNPLPVGARATALNSTARVPLAAGITIPFSPPGRRCPKGG